ncbi:adaptor protein Ste4 [Schizosaccharomyces japonicus yFS275]|uniref:Adaptor protein Ste4 n=1 Tax=Schizosaccharomyces japonicus (strain yFS275 / FY16936) TaxID=402676 RepID=B6K3Z3_SCHJY|nr:adaptor protein Ste4 [Schizosaccharomyces japonicus yFS275]EEB08200.2 adaptor protein Ste4 [Schizosaccharomyces japonicus yFS275]
MVRERSLNVLEWSVDDVAEWVETLGLTQKDVFREHRLDGKDLVQLEMEDLHDMGIESLGDRLDLVSAITKLKQGLHVEDAVDESTATSSTLVPKRSMSSSLEKRLVKLERELELLSKSLSTLKVELLPALSKISVMLKQSKRENSISSQMAAQSPTQMQFPAPSSVQPTSQPQSLSKSLPSPSLSQTQSQSTATTAAASTKDSSCSASPDGLSLTETVFPFDPAEVPRPSSEESVKGRMNVNSSYQEVLQSTLRRYHINVLDWQGYELLLAYDGVEHEIPHKDKPLQLFRSLQKAGKQPSFILSRRNVH